MKKAFFSLTVITLLILMTEVGLRLLDIADPLQAIDLDVGFAEETCFFIKDNQGVVETNVSKYTSLFPTRFNAIKDNESTFRIMILGGSNVYFFDQNLSYFKAALEKFYTNLTVEVINLGALSYGSHRLRKLYLQGLMYQPDLLILYLGHNEFEEKRFFKENIQTQSSHLRFIRNQFHRSRIYLLLRLTIRRFLNKGMGVYGEREILIEKDGKLAEVDEMHDEAVYEPVFQPEYRDRVLDEYSQNVDHMISASKKAGTKVVVCSVAYNLFTRPFAPCAPDLSDNSQDSILERSGVGDRLSELLADEPGTTLKLQEYNECKKVVDDFFRQNLPFLFGIDIEKGEFFRLFQLKAHKSSPARYGLYSHPSYVSFMRFFNRMFDGSEDHQINVETDESRWDYVDQILTGMLKTKIDADTVFYKGLSSYHRLNFSRADEYLRISALLDCSPRKATDRINSILKELAGTHSVPFFDAERIIISEAHDGLPGWDCFVDHCHLNAHSQKSVLLNLALFCVSEKMLENTN